MKAYEVRVPYTGERVFITGRDHPWRGHAGDIVDVKGEGNGWSLTVELDNGMRSMVWPGDWTRADKTAGQ